MGIKIKKDNRTQTQKFKTIEVKYLLAVPLLGIVEFFTMLSFYFDPNVQGMVGAKIFAAFFALVGLGFTYWGYMWKIIADNKHVTVRPVFGTTKEVVYGDIKKIIVNKKKKRKDSMRYYAIITNNDTQLVRVYTIMKNSGELYNRLTLLGVPTEEIRE